MSSVALTDNGNMFGAIEFYFACKDAGVNAILGLDAYLAPKSRLIKGEDPEVASNPFRKLVLLAQDYEGYQNLCQIGSIGYREGFYYRPRIDMDVLKKYNQKIIALTGGVGGEIPSLFLKEGPDAALKKIKELKEVFPERLYIEILRTGLPEWNEINKFLLEAAKITSLPIVATNDVHYQEPDDQIAQEVLICIGTNKTLQDSTRYRLGTDQFFFKDGQQMVEVFKDLPEAVANTLEISKRCKVDFKLKDKDGKPIYHLPSFPTQAGRSVDEEIAELSREGLLVRFEEAKKRNEEVPESEKPKYYERLKYELRVIGSMGFNGYFLIVQDFINWAKSQGIPVGPGRGSGAASLVAYSLRITDLDPMEHNLVFERFLNPERISMPDFDIDFCQDRRGEVIDYVTQKYGESSVSQIITYGKLQARAAIRDVGRVLGMTYADVDVVSKLIPEKLGITLKEAIAMEPKISEAMEANPQVATMFELAQKVEGLVRHAGIHAAGVVIADGELVKYAPLYRGADGENVVQYDMKHAEKIGLIKFDFLGLKTLTHITYALELIRKNRQKEITVQEIPLSDSGIYDLMSSGDTAGVFQFEGDGITNAVLKIQPSNFADITAINALYRPGPMDMIPDYTARKKGTQKVQYIFPELEPILSETYGVIVYQEQVLQIAARIANYSLGEADVLRRAMGKKIAEEMAKQKTRFIEGASKNGFDSDKSAELFALMEEFANYGFNKAHAAAYCVVAAHTAWLKRYFPVEFYAALLTTEMGDTDKVEQYVKDAKVRDIEVEPPHINHSECKFTVRGEKIYFGLGAIKGVGEAAVESIVAAREAMPEKKFKTLEEFFDNVDLRRINKKVIECLIKAGAFDNLGAHRAQLLAGYNRFVDRSSVTRNDRDLGQESLFAMVEMKDDVRLDDVPAWSRAQRLANEKEVFGFYLTEHPLTGYDSLFRPFTSAKVKELVEAPKAKGKRPVAVAGIITGLKEIITRKGTRMAFATLEDLTGGIELVIFPNTYSETLSIIKSDKPLIVSAQLESNDEGAKLIAEKIELFETRLGKIKSLVMKLDHSMTQHMDELGKLLSENPGNVTVNFQIYIDDLKRVVQMVPEDQKGIKPTPEMVEKLYRLYGNLDFIEMNS